MKSKLLNVAWLLISLSCICGMCSKGDDQSDDPNNNGSNPNNPVLKPDETWVYFDDAPLLVYFYPGNTRPESKKWVATKVSTAFAGFNSGNATRFFNWSFENTGNTRFLSDALNPGGKESFSVSIQNFNKTPGPGSYQMDVDYRGGYCWYYVKTSSGALHDSTRTQGMSNSQFNITSMVFGRTIGPTIDIYFMTGTATFNIMYWQNGTGSTTDIHTLQCTFNKVPVSVQK